MHGSVFVIELHYQKKTTKTVTISHDDENHTSTIWDDHFPNPNDVTDFLPNLHLSHVRLQEKHTKNRLDVDMSNARN